MYETYLYFFGCAQLCSPLQRKTSQPSLRVITRPVQAGSGESELWDTATTGDTVSWALGCCDEQSPAELLLSRLLHLVRGKTGPKQTQVNQDDNCFSDRKVM